MIDLLILVVMGEPHPAVAHIAVNFADASGTIWPQSLASYHTFVKSGWPDRYLAKKGRHSRCLTRSVSHLPGVKFESVIIFGGNCNNTVCYRITPSPCVSSTNKITPKTNMFRSRKPSQIVHLMISSHGHPLQNGEPTCQKTQTAVRNHKTIHQETSTWRRGRGGS